MASDQIEEVKERILSEVNTRTYSPFLFCLTASLVVSHYEILLFLFDGGFNSGEKIKKIEGYWKDSGDIKDSLLRGLFVFLAWCVIHPTSALLWDLIKRGIDWGKKKLVYNISVIPTQDYEDLVNAHEEELKEYNKDHADMRSKVEQLKLQLSQVESNVERAKDNEKRAKDQQEKNEELHKSEIKRLKESHNREIENSKNNNKSKVSQLERDLERKRNDAVNDARNRERLETELAVLKAENYDLKNWEFEANRNEKLGYTIRYQCISPLNDIQLHDLNQTISNIRSSDDDIIFDEKHPSGFKTIWAKKGIQKLTVYFSQQQIIVREKNLDNNQAKLIN